MDQEKKKLLVEYLMGFLTDQRISTFQKILQERTKHITVVLEDIYQPHNASAVLRTCDLTGVQDVHIIENRNTYEPNPEVAMGAYKWVSMIKYNKEANNTLSTFASLREKGYLIVATTPHKDGFTPENLPLDKKVALVFGTELQGLSSEALENADAYIQIPMFGFTESFNISVSAALILYNLSQRLRHSDIDWHLTESEKTDILLEWVRNSIKKPAILEKEYLKMLNS